MSSITMERKLWLNDMKQEVIEHVSTLLSNGETLRYRHLSRKFNIPRTTLKRMIDAEFSHSETHIESIRGFVFDSLDENMSMPTLSEIRRVTKTNLTGRPLMYYLSQVYKEYVDFTEERDAYYTVSEISECLGISRLEVKDAIKSALNKMHKYIYSENEIRDYFYE